MHVYAAKGRSQFMRSIEVDHGKKCRSDKSVTYLSEFKVKAHKKTDK